MEPSDSDLAREVVPLLQDLLRADTSNPPGHETRAAVVLKAYLEAAGLPCELVAREPERANLIARIEGTGEGPSLALLGHTDVVPVEDAPDWERGPFSGDLDDNGYVWGRGAVDMKNQTAARAVAIALLARSGWRPRGDLVFVAQADEEDGTHQVGLTWLRHQRPDLACDYSLDEGGGMRLELADGRVLVTLNVGEKATLPALVTVLGEAGHASVPSPSNAVLRLSTIIGRLGQYQPERTVTPAGRRMLELLVGSPDGNLEEAIARAGSLHPWLERTLPARFCTTISPTRLTGSPARNVIPSRASVECDCRVLPGTTPPQLEAELRRALGDDLAYEIAFLEEPTGGTTSPVDSPLARICQEFLDRHDPGATVFPTISTGFNDSHFMRESFGTTAYGFSPFRRSADIDEDARAHARNERVHVEDLVHTTRFHLFAAQRLSEVGRA